MNVADDNPYGLVPVDLIVVVGKYKLAMKGTEGRNPRCAALNGFVGSLVSCMIYSQRPSACRDFIGAWEPNMVNPTCNRARAYYGLPSYDPF